MAFNRDYVFYFIFLCCLSACNTLDKNIGSTCKMRIRGTGICKKIADCPKVKEQKNLGIPPTICNMKSGIVVCCPGAAPATPQVLAKSAPPVNSFTPLSTSNENLRKCQQKCLEYSAPVQSSIYAAPLSIDRVIVQTQFSKCSFETKPLIFGGSQADYGEYPHMALIGTGTPPTWYCGGSLISDQFVVSAAHCFFTRYGAVNMVRLGELSLSKPESNSEPEDIRVEKNFIHPQYNNKLVYHDIALIKLVKRVTLSTYIRPACLWNKLTITENKVIATGWGTTENDHSKMNDVLLKVGLNIVEQSKCQEVYKNFSSQKVRDIRRNIVCATNNTGGDTCQGDSGGPLEISDSNNQCIHYIIGITSAGRGCGSNVPGLYTRVSEYIDWIEGIVWP